MRLRFRTRSGGTTLSRTILSRRGEGIEPWPRRRLSTGTTRCCSTQQLTDDERMVRDAAHAYCQEKLAPRVLEAFRHEKTDPAIFREMGELGPARRRPSPSSYGGAGLNYVCYGLIAREVERVDSGYRSMMSVQSSLVMVPIYEFGTEAHEAEVPAQARHRRMDRLLRPDRAEPRLRSRQHGHAREEGAGRLLAHRHQDVDHQLADRRRVRRLGQGRRRRDPRLRPREGLRRACRRPAIHGKVGPARHRSPARS